MAESDVRLEDILPEYGWRVKLDHTFPQKPRPSKLPRWRQLPKLVGLGYRFMKYATKEKKAGRVPFIDPYKMNPCRQIYEARDLTVPHTSTFTDVNCVRRQGGFNWPVVITTDG